MKRALVSVSDKTNLVPFVSGLVELGYEIISTGGTKKALEDNGIKTIGISEVTDFPEIMDGIIPREEWAGVIEPHYPRGKRGRNSRRIFCFLQKILDISAVFL